MARGQDSARGAANRLTTQQAQTEAKAPSARRRELATIRKAALQNTMQRWVRGVPNGANDADQTPPEDDHPAKNDVRGSATGVARKGTASGTGHEAEASGTLEADTDLG